MEIGWLKYFYTVAKQGGYLRAAESLKVAQPSISKLVKQLEDELGEKLFEKTGRNVRLTKYGSDVYRHCEVIFGEIERIAQINPKKRGEVGGRLIFGASEALASQFIPGILESFLKKHPRVIPTIISSTSTDMCRQVALGQMEFALLLHTPELSNELEIRKNWEVPHSVVVLATKAKEKEVLTRFIGSREVDDTSTKSFPTLKKLQQNHPETSIVISTNSITAQRDMVLRGMGVAVMPTLLVEREIRNGKLKELLASEKLHFPIRLIARKDQVFSVNTEEWLKSWEKSLPE